MMMKLAIYMQVVIGLEKVVINLFMK